MIHHKNNTSDCKKIYKKSLPEAWKYVIHTHFSTKIYFLYKVKENRKETYKSKTKSCYEETYWKNYILVWIHIMKYGKKRYTTQYEYDHKICYNDSFLCFHTFLEL